MKRRLLLFIIEGEDGIHHDRRGDFLCFPCTLAHRECSAAHAFYDIFHRSRIFLTGFFPTPAIIAESYTNEHGQEQEFEFGGEKVIAEFYVIRNCIKYFHNVFDRTQLDPDVFVRFFEKQRHGHKQAHAA